jgi:hypothetical protein
MYQMAILNASEILGNQTGLGYVNWWGAVKPFRINGP